MEVVILAQQGSSCEKTTLKLDHRYPRMAITL
jgi:hypothetical protein